VEGVEPSALIEGLLLGLHVSWTKVCSAGHLRSVFRLEKFPATGFEADKRFQGSKTPEKEKAWATKSNEVTVQAVRERCMARWLKIMAPKCYRFSQFCHCSIGIMYLSPTLREARNPCHFSCGPVGMVQLWLFATSEVDRTKASHAPWFMKFSLTKAGVIQLSILGGIKLDTNLRQFWVICP